MTIIWSVDLLIFSPDCPLKRSVSATCVCVLDPRSYWLLTVVMGSVWRDTSIPCSPNVCSSHLGLLIVMAYLNWPPAAALTSTSPRLRDTSDVRLCPLSLIPSDHCLSPFFIPSLLLFRIVIASPLHVTLSNVEWLRPFHRNLRIMVAVDWWLLPHKFLGGAE